MSLIDNNSYDVTDGIPINEGVHHSLEDNQISFANVIIKDGNLELDIPDIFEFVDNTNGTEENIFYSIKDLMVFSFDQVTIEDICESGDFGLVCEDITKQMENKKIIDN